MEGETSYRDNALPLVSTEEEPAPVQLLKRLLALGDRLRWVKFRDGSSSEDWLRASTGEDSSSAVIHLSCSGYILQVDRQDVLRPFIGWKERMGTEGVICGLVNQLREQAFASINERDRRSAAEAADAALRALDQLE